MTLVLGMHRSGTSVLTAAIHCLGASLGERLVPPADDNPGGYFENARAVEINEEFLLAIGSGWDDPRPFRPDWLDGPSARSARSAIRALLAEEFARSSWSALKDPRLCRLLPLWLPELRAAGFHLDAVLATRNPEAITASLTKRDRMGSEASMVLTLRHWVAAEHDSRDLPRACLDYDAWIDAPEPHLRRIARQLNWPVKGRTAYSKAAKLIDAEQRHHRAAPPAFRDGLAGVLAEAFGLLEDPIDSHAISRLEALSRCIPLSAPDEVDGLRAALLRERQRGVSLGREASDLRFGLEVAESLSRERLEALEQTDRVLS
ncbi:hypothetical protein, partial [Silanimonas lenta]|uniref:sulfotransferase family protein n=1 Tax=Silanimonas lenta TaxID=265429 RepID=UPI002FE1E26E